MKKIIVQNGVASIMNARGEAISTFGYKDGTYVFVGELCAIPDINGNWGIININGERLCDFRYNFIRLFSNRTAKFMVGNKYGLLDKNLKEILPPSFKSIKKVTEYDFYIVNDFSETYIYDLTSEKRLAGFGDSNICDIQIDGVWKTVHISGKCEDKTEGAKYIQGGLYGLINHNGDVVCPAIYDTVDINQSISYAIVGFVNVDYFNENIKTSKFGIIRKDNGKIIIPCSYDYIEEISEYGALVGSITIHNFDDFEYKLALIPFNDPSNIYYIKDESPEYMHNINGSAIYEGCNGAYNCNGESYNEVSATERDNIIVKKDGLYGLVNRAGENLLEIKYTALFEQGEIYFMMNKDKKWAVFSETDNILTSFIFASSDDAISYAEQKLW